MKKILLFGLCVVLSAHTVMALETIPNDVLGIVIAKIDPQVRPIYFSNQYENVYLEAFFPLLASYQPTKDIVNVGSINKQMLNRIRMLLEKAKNDRTNILNFFNENEQKDLRCFYKYNELFLFSGLYNFSFDHLERECVLQMKLKKISSFSRCSLFTLDICISTIDNSLQVQRNRSFCDGWCDRKRLLDHFHLCYKCEENEDQKAVIAQWIVFLEKWVISNELIQPSGDGSQKNALITTIYLDEHFPLTATLFSELSSLKDLQKDLLKNK